MEKEKYEPTQEELEKAGELILDGQKHSTEARENLLKLLEETGLEMPKDVEIERNDNPGRYDPVKTISASIRGHKIRVQKFTDDSVGLEIDGDRVGDSALDRGIPKDVFELLEPIAGAYMAYHVREGMAKGETGSEARKERIAHSLKEAFNIEIKKERY